MHHSDRHYQQGLQDVHARSKSIKDKGPLRHLTAIMTILHTTYYSIPLSSIRHWASGMCFPRRRGERKWGLEFRASYEIPRAARTRFGFPRGIPLTNQT